MRCVGGCAVGGANGGASIVADGWGPGWQEDVGSEIGPAARLLLLSGWPVPWFQVGTLSPVTFFLNS